MHAPVVLAALVVTLAPCIASAQANPVAEAFRNDAASVGKNLMAAASEFPANKFGYKPTPAQMSFADIVVHLAQGNDLFCGKIGGATAPQRSKVGAADGKAVLVARLRETFQFCDVALAKVDDKTLAESMPLFGPKPMTRAAIMTLTTGDWADHYSQMAIYMRLNNLVPPSAKKPGA